MKFEDLLDFYIDVGRGEGTGGQEDRKGGRLLQRRRLSAFNDKKARHPTGVKAHDVIDEGCAARRRKGEHEYATSRSR